MPKPLVVPNSAVDAAAAAVGGGPTVGATAVDIIAQELALCQRVSAFLAELSATAGDKDQHSGQHDADLIELRDAIAEAKPEDVAPLVEQMARVSAVAVGRRGKQAAPIDVQAPYFAHLRLRPSSPPKAQPRDVLIGRRGLIDRAAGIQIVDWRDAPVSQIYYRYDEGDDYDEVISGSTFLGIIEVRRNITIQGGVLRRIGCPQGSFYCDTNGQWWEADALSSPTLQGGQGLAARAPRPAGPVPKPGAGKGPRPAAALGHGPGPAPAPSASPGGGEAPRPVSPAGPPGFATRVDKHLPEIAALIDRHQFDLITEPDSGVVVIQGGAGSGKTTVALHRVAYLAFQKPDRFRGSKVMIIVPSEALVRYVSGVLPALGVPGVPVQTSAGWMRHHRKRLLPHLPQRQSGETPPTVARLKKHPGMVKVIEQYIADQATAMRGQLAAALADFPTAAERVLGEWDGRAARPLRLRCRGVRHIVSGHLEPGLGVRIDELLRRLSRRAGDVGRDWAELLTDSERLWRGLSVESPAHNPSAPVSRADIAELVAYCKAQQEEVEELPEDVDVERYQAVDGQPLDDDSPAGQLDVEDDPLLLYLLGQKLGGLEHSSSKGNVSYEHMVVDEVQDLSVIELKVLIGCVSTEPDDKKKGGSTGGGRTHPQSLTLAGDVAQRLVFDNGFSRWEDLLPLCGLRGVQIQRLRIMYRSTAEVLELAQAVLGPLLTEDSTQNATRHGAPVRAFSFGEMGEAVAFLGEALRSLLLREPTASVALIARHIGTANAFYQGLSRADVPSLRRVARHEFMFTAGVDVTDVTQVKGLEFDYVVILDATAAAYTDSTEARHLLHIAITRCAHQLWLLAASPPSPLIPASYFSEEFAPTGA